MSDVIFNILFFVIIFSFLTYSCQWFGRTLRRYHEAGAEEREGRRNAVQTSQSSGFSVYTIEHGRRTLINYSNDMPPRSPAHFVIKDELPPTYDDALKMQQVTHEVPVAPSASANFSAPTVSTQRRNSSVL